MSYKALKVYNLADAVEMGMRMLNVGREIECEDQDRMTKCKEISLCITSTHPFDGECISKAMPCGLNGLVEYVEEFINGSRDFEPIWEYTYHKLYAPYIGKAIEELKRNRTTRRAVINLGGAINFDNPHPPCLQMIMFEIRNDKLNMTSVFRSNDGCKAFAMNMFALAVLQLNVAMAVGVEMGEYTHIAESFHCYERDYKDLEDYCHRFDEMSPMKTRWTYNQFIKAQDKHLASYYNWIADRRRAVEVHTPYQDSI